MSESLAIPPDVRSWAEIDLDALVANARTARAQLTGKQGVLAVVKADAYGHGVEACARALAPEVEAFGVANVTEAEELAAYGLEPEILLLSASLPAERPAVIARRFIASISSAEEAAGYAALAGDEPALLNFKVDTGMGRMGCWQDEALATLREIVSFHQVRVRMVSTHLPVSDEDRAFTEKELEDFAALAAEMARIAPGVRVHCLNSAGIMGFARHAGDLVRAGLMLYGSAYPAEYQATLRPVLTWKARVILVREVPSGRSVSYGRTFITSRSTRIATLPVGYADGFPRQASGQGAEVLVGGRRCPVLGRVTMDQILVDVTHAPDTMVGDEAVLIGRQGGEEILARELAEKAGTIAWDIFTGLKRRVARFYRQVRS